MWEKRGFAAAYTSPRHSTQYNIKAAAFMAEAAVLLFCFFFGGEGMGWKSTFSPYPEKAATVKVSAVIFSPFSSLDLLSCFLDVRNQRCQLRMEGTDVNPPPFLHFYFYCATYLFPYEKKVKKILQYIALFFSIRHPHHVCLLFFVFP